MLKKRDEFYKDLSTFITEHQNHIIYILQVKKQCTTVLLACCCLWCFCTCTTSVIISFLFHVPHFGILVISSGSQFNELCCFFWQLFNCLHCDTTMYILLSRISRIMDCNFTVRMLHRNMYWLVYILALHSALFLCTTVVRQFVINEHVMYYTPEEIRLPVFLVVKWGHILPWRQTYTTHLLFTMAT